jgi:hypothetical protein
VLNSRPFFLFGGGFISVPCGKLCGTEPVLILI